MQEIKITIPYQPQNLKSQIIQSVETLIKMQNSVMVLKMQKK